MSTDLPKPRLLVCLNVSTVKLTKRHLVARARACPFYRCTSLFVTP